MFLWPSFRGAGAKTDFLGWQAWACTNHDDLLQSAIPLMAAGRRGQAPARPAIRPLPRLKLRRHIQEEAAIRRVDGAQIIRNLAPEIAATNPEVIAEQAVDTEKRRGLGRA